MSEFKFKWHFCDHGKRSLVEETLKEAANGDFHIPLDHLAYLLDTLFDPKEGKEQLDLLGRIYLPFVPNGDGETVGPCYTTSFGTQNHIRIWHHYHCQEGAGELICEIEFSHLWDPHKVMGELQSKLGRNGQGNIPSLTQAIYNAANAAA